MILLLNITCYYWILFYIMDIFIILLDIIGYDSTLSESFGYGYYCVLLDIILDHEIFIDMIRKECEFICLHRKLLDLLHMI